MCPYPNWSNNNLKKREMQEDLFSGAPAGKQNSSDKECCWWISCPPWSIYVVTKRNIHGLKGKVNTEK
jgi:hypothetical protein